MDGSLQTQDDDEPPAQREFGTPSGIDQGQPPQQPQDSSGSPELASASASASASAPTPATTPQEPPQEPPVVAAMKKEKGRVRFNSSAAGQNPFADPPHTRPHPQPHPHGSGSGSGSASGPVSGSSPTTDSTESPIARPRPTIHNHNGERKREHSTERQEAIDAAAAAQERARQVAVRVQRDTPSPTSPRWEPNPHAMSSDGNLSSSSKDIPLQDMGSSSRQGGWQQLSAEDEEHQAMMNQEAYELVRAHTWRTPSKATETLASHDEGAPLHTAPAKGPPSEVNDGNYDGLYRIPAPEHYRGNVLSQLLRLYKPPVPGESSRNASRDSMASPGDASPGTPKTGSTTPNKRKWYEQNRSQDTLINLVGASARLANPLEPSPEQKSPTDGKKRPTHKRTGSSSRLSTFIQKEEEQARITVHIAETLSRQEYIIKLCRALMMFGAPTHRLEEYLKATAKILEIDSQYLYLPGCMIISFDDTSTHTTEVRIVRCAQGIDLGKLKDTHQIYKEVIHDVIGAEDGARRLEDIMSAKDKFHAWIRVLVFGLTSVTASPFSFSARLIDLPLCFLFGCVVGILQLIVAPKSMLYSNVLEVSAAVLVSFLARAFGSINGGDLFCFSALAQGGIVMLLPGYLVLCSALELQSRAIVPGSIRIVYAIIYSLFLGFGILVGAALYGVLDDNATSETTCKDPIDPYLAFISVPPFVLCISILYQAKWRQMPVMLVVAFAGYVVNFFSFRRFAAAPQIANTLGAFTVGVLANLYSRIRHGVAAATLIPAIFTQVPGGLASTGGLLSGLTTANMLTNSSHADNGTTSDDYGSGQNLNTTVFNVAASMIQIAIGIAVGLFISALIIYPLGKRRSGLFSF